MAYNEAAFQTMLKAYGGLAAQSVTPVFVDGRLLALLSLHELRAPRQWTQEEIDLATEQPSGCGTSCEDPRGARAQPLASGLEPVAAVAPGAEVTFETRDGIDGQLIAGSRHEDAFALDLGLGHPLTGPVFVEDAEPGDLLEVEFLDYEAAAVHPGVRLPGGSLPRPVCREMGDRRRVRAVTQELPGVAVPAAVFAGVAGGTALRRLTVAAARRAEPRHYGLAGECLPKDQWSLVRRRRLRKSP